MMLHQTTISKLYFCIMAIFTFFRTHHCYTYLNARVEDIVVDFVNDTYFDEDTFDIAMDYRTESQNVVTMRIDIIQDLPQNIHLKCVLWGYASGQYNVPTGIEMDLNVCDNRFKDYFFNVILTKMNLDKECPAKKGTYENEGFDPEITGFPLSLPSGFRLLLESTSYSGNINLLKAKAYLVVV